MINTSLWLNTYHNILIIGIRDAGSTAVFKILFEILKFKKLEIRKC